MSEEVQNVKEVLSASFLKILFCVSVYMPPLCRCLLRPEDNMASLGTEVTVVSWSTEESKAEGLLQVWDQAGLHNAYLANQAT